ncbi:MAG: nitrile hydratase subunit beta [Gammaproteobacteria bacterium]
MNGIHDLGGMTCFGPVHRENDEPIFHTDWERRVFAMNFVALAFLGPVDRLRHAIERMDPVDYLTTTYYEHWLDGLLRVAKDLGYLTDEEIETGHIVSIKPTPHPPPNAEMAEGLVRGGMPATRDGGRSEPIFKPGDKVRARNIETTGHSRLARCVKGKVGVVTAHHGSHVFPDTAAHDRGESPQPLYTIRFEARELWGDNVDRRDCVHIDLWEDYLEPEKTEATRS